MGTYNILYYVVTPWLHNASRLHVQASGDAPCCQIWTTAATTTDRMAKRMIPSPMRFGTFIFPHDFTSTNAKSHSKLVKQLLGQYIVTHVDAEGFGDPGFSASKWPIRRIQPKGVRTEATTSMIARVLGFSNPWFRKMFCIVVEMKM